MSFGFAEGRGDGGEETSGSCLGQELTFDPLRSAPLRLADCCRQPELCCVVGTQDEERLRASGKDKED